MGSRRYFLLAALGSLLLLAAPTRATAEPIQKPITYVVIVHPKNKVKSVGRKFLADAFLKKRTRWDDDRKIMPVDLKHSAPLRSRFSEEVVGRSVTAIKSYWRQVVFSGRGLAPPEMEKEEGVIAFVRKHEGAVGYVSSDADLDGVKVISVR